ncbi:class I SAM-dependent RNA methyltransferase [Aliiroseovarius subalbicans]|uniref:class I SAM-dependent RNA methyltransferase n=1 Tax=Aliiroseovarius subalbicans TaxID=2925840 RepID=UPI001F595111|nr:class I SAM-dependent RNA methyltransferase [Aliiroseovarius subalbicans]MCI2400039.1 class I SAM-dependent RNA methyltransferase [Aliiroseovarius subalbicans]
MTEATIMRLGHLGDGIAEGPIFAARTLPGEVIEGTLDGDRIASPRILTPSPNRVRPPCRHVRACGGCAMQHAADDFVAGWKSDVVRAALTAHGISADLAGIETSLPHERRRATMSMRRTKKGALVGFHAPRSDVLTAVPDCLLLHPDLTASFPALEALAVLGGSRKGEMSATITQSIAGVDVAVNGGKPLDRHLEVGLAQLAGEHGLARLAWDGELVVERHAPVQLFGKAQVVPPPGAFLQATKSGEQALLTVVRDAVQGARRVVDLFAGCGTFTLPVAQDSEVHAVEGLESMMSALDAGWRKAQGLKHVSTETRDLFRRPLLPDELNRFDAAIIDPPRAGAEAQIAEIAASKLTRLAMVSCNPVSFARDVAVLRDAGFKLGPVQVVDQFRWSTHVEVAAALTR